MCHNYDQGFFAKCINMSNEHIVFGGKRPFPFLIVKCNMELF